MASPTPPVRPLVVGWTLLGGVLGALIGVAAPAGDVVILGACLAWGALAGGAARASRVLQLARAGVLEPRADLPPHRTPRSLGPGLVLGAIAGAAVGAASLGLARALPSGTALAVGLALASGAAAWAAAALWRTPLQRTGPTRKSTLAAWVLVDTALPASLLAGPFGAGVLALRLRAQTTMEAEPLARHLAWTLVLYGLFLGVAGFAKTRRERLAGLVDAPYMTSPSPGPLALGGLLAVVLVLAGPGLLPALDVGAAVVVKLVFGFLAAFGASALGALKGARDPTQRDGPKR